MSYNSSENPLLVYTCLFTPVGTSPNNNKYINMLYIWLSFLIRNGGLLKTDNIYILIDNVSLDVLNDNEIISSIIKTSEINITFILIPQPETISHGMVERFNINNNILSNYSLYLDLDMLVVQNIRKRLKIVHPNSIVAFREDNNTISHNCYAGELLDYSSGIDENQLGLTSACFLFSQGEGICTLFNNISKDILANVKTPFYTIDQPFFNKYLMLYRYIEKNIVNVFFVETSEEIIINNLYKRNSLSLFHNFYGEPGNSNLHYTKAFTMLCTDYINSVNKE
jgi:hypothetical protein